MGNSIPLTCMAKVSAPLPIFFAPATHRQPANRPVLAAGNFFTICSMASALPNADPTVRIFQVSNPFSKHSIAKEMTTLVEMVSMI
jgi:hypothetical protein